MRVLFLAFMIVLLPLRGGVGDAMAMDMLASGHETAASVHASIDGQPDCHAQAAGHANLAQFSVPAMDGETAHHLVLSDASADCGACSACQICHTVALPAMHLPLAPDMAPLVHAARPVGHYASADRAPGFKPPIF